MEDLRAHGPTSGRDPARRGRPPAPILDRTPLNGATIDVPARVGWLLRTARLSVDGGLPLRDLVARLGDVGTSVSESTLSRVEAGRLRSGALVDAYERALGLPPTSLRAPIDVLCRTAGEDPGRRPGEATLDSVSEAVEPVLDGTPDGRQWLAFADTLAHPDVVALPRGLATGAVRRLASEVRRSVGHGVGARYEALALISCSRYGEVLLDVALEMLDTPGAPPLLDLARALGECPRPRLVVELATRLRGASGPLTESIVAALDSASVRGNLPASAWEPLLQPLAEAYADSAGLPWHRVNLAYLVRTLPGEPRRRVQELIAEPLPDPIRQPVNWTTTRHNSHHTAAVDLAQRITRDAGLTEQPLLARILFEALYDPRLSRSLPSVVMLGALPFHDVVVRHVAALHEESPDEATRVLASWLLLQMRSPAAAHFVADWLGPEEHGLVAALVTAHAGGEVRLEHVEPHLGKGPSHRVRGLAALGLAGSPDLADLAEGRHPDTDAEVRATARWLLADGPRVTS